MHGGDIYRNDVDYDFSVNINPLGMPDEVRDAFINSAGLLGNYPDIKCERLKRAIADKININEKNIVVGNGASELINAVSIAAAPKKILLMMPAFSGYRRAAEASGADIVEYRTKEENAFDPDQDIFDLLKEDIDILYMANPNNPTGRMVNAELLKKILERCEKNGTLLILDECFITLAGKAFTCSMSTEINKYKKLCIIRSFTKTYAIPGIRLGYMICGDEELLRKTEMFRGEWSVSVPAQESGCAALQCDKYLLKSVDYISNERKWMIEELKKIGYNVIDSDVDFILFRADLGLYDYLLRYKVLIRDCSDYEVLEKGWYRIAIKKHEENEYLLSLLGKYKA